VGTEQSPLCSQVGSPLQGPRFFASLPCSSFSAKACGLWRGGTGVKQSPLVHKRESLAGSRFFALLPCSSLFAKP